MDIDYSARNSCVEGYGTTISRAVTEGNYGWIYLQKFLTNPPTFLDIDYSARNSCVEGYGTTISRAVTEGSYGWIDSQKFLTIPSTFLGMDYSTRFRGYIILLVIDSAMGHYDTAISRAVTDR